MDPYPPPRQTAPDSLRTVIAGAILRARSAGDVPQLEQLLHVLEESRQTAEEALRRLRHQAGP